MTRILLEFSSTHIPITDAELLTWSGKLRRFMRSGDPSVLPDGVVFVAVRGGAETETMRDMT